MHYFTMCICKVYGLTIDMYVDAVHSSVQYITIIGTFLVVPFLLPSLACALHCDQTVKSPARHTSMPLHRATLCCAVLLSLLPQL